MKKLSLAIALALASASYGASAGFGDLLGGSKGDSDKKLDMGSMISDVKTVAAAFQEPKLPDLRIAAQQSVVKQKLPNALIQTVLQKLIKAHGEEIELPKVIVTTDLKYTAQASLDEIAISNGILYDAGSEDEIAFILAHELSHVIKGHYNTNEYFAKQERLVKVLSKLSMAITLIRSKAVEGKPANKEDLAKIKNQQEDTLKLQALINDVSEYMLNSSLTRAHEEEADLLAIDLLAKTDYSVNGYVDAFARLEQSEQFVEDKLADIQERLIALMVLMDGDSAETDSTEKQLIKTIMRVASSEVLKTFAKEHPYAADRRKVVAKYVKKEYRKQKRSTVDEAKYAQLKQQADFKNSVAAYAVVADLDRKITLASKEGRKERISDSDINKVITASSALLKEDDAYTRYVLANAYKELNKDAEYIKQIQAISNLDGASQTIFEAVMSYQLEAGDYAQLKKTVDLAMSLIGEAPAFYPYLVSYFGHEQDNGGLKTALSGCTEHGFAIHQRCEAIAERYKPEEAKTAEKTDRKKGLSLF